MAQKQNTSISLGAHFTDFISAQVQAGRYSSVSEAVRAGLRLLEEREITIGALRQALTDGENSGFVDTFDSAKFLATLKARHGAKV